ncbi:MAG: heme exporter protein CcmB [Pseudomonadota bacterium]
MFSIFAHEVKYYFKNRVEAIYIYSYLISIILIVPFAVAPGEGQLQALAPLTLWIALASAVTLGGMGLFVRDHDQGRLEYYQLLPISLESLVFAKWAAFYLFILAPLLVVLPLAAMLFGIPASHIGHYAIGLAASAAALTMLTSLIAALMSGLEKAGAVLGLIVLPLTIPIMIFGTQYCRDFSTDWQSSLLFLLGFTVFFLPLTCIAGAYSIRAAN